MPLIYPFAAIVGQDALKTALLLCAVNPGLGGVLIRGDKGTAKSTAARGLAAVLPPIPRVPGCAFNCAPTEALGECAACQAEVEPIDAAVPFVNLPLGATEDRVLGSLDFERALKGSKAFQPGLLASAHRGILYIDEVNLLADHLVDVLLDVAAMGVNTVQREGLSLSHPARITLIGTMNLEEGELRPQLLDRFGLMVEVSAPRDPAVRAEVVRRRVQFEADPAAFALHWQAETAALQAGLQTARELLPEVTLSDALLEFISRLCCEFEVSSLRADIVMHKAARTLAALDGRRQVTAEDVRTAAELVLPHRRRRKPFEQTGLDRDQLDQLMQDAPEPPAPPPPPPSEQDMREGESSGEDARETGAGASEQVFAAGAASNVARLQVQGESEISGRRSSSAKVRQGHYVRAVPTENPGRLALDATLRHALQRNPAAFQVTRADLHEQQLRGKGANLILLVVDASGSMGAHRRMETVKGCVLGLLEDAYQRRDQVAVIAFRGDSAELVLAPTRKIEQAERALQSLPTGGRTPLAHALQLAAETLARQGDGAAPLLVILSDGRANVAQAPGAEPWAQSLAFAEQLAAQSIPALVLDTEQDFIKLGRARQLAQALRAEYLPLEGLSAADLALTIRARLS
ncbi:putative cobaltochelatase [Thermithiobacillus plumbiphilus]|uniref:Mg-protoporphyrin IX chelatase n=1 Tax=Thermithiobacillus plumbiphilus TaxID=1729899 RepID=A0ABU9D515_9PROT